MEFPKQFYGSDGQVAIFASLADVPAGWHDHPGHYDKQRGIWVAHGTPNPGDIRTDAERAADIAGEPPRYVQQERKSGLGYDWDGNGTPLRHPLDAGAAAAERSRIVEGKPLSPEEQALRNLDKDGRDNLADRPVLTGLNKAALLAEAKRIGADVADDATNREIREAIEAKRG